MKFSIQKAALVAAVETVGRFIKNRAALPILSNLCLDAHPDHGLVMMGTDLNTGLRLKVPAAQIHLDGAGSATVNAADLKDVLKRLPGGNVEISSEDDRPLQVQAGKFRCSLPTLPALEYPAWVDAKANGERFTLSRGALRTLVDRVGIAAADTDEARPVMTGILVLANEDTLTMVATDGRRLARAAQGLPEEEGRSVRCVVPRATLHELARLLKGADEEAVTVHLSTSLILFQWNGTEMSGRLLEGSFPDFNRVIPKQFQRTFKAPTDELLASVRRVARFGQEPDSPSLVTFHFGDGEVRLTAHSNDAGSAEDSLAGILSGEPLTIAFNGQYVADGLSVLGTEECELFLQDASHSAILRRAGDDAGDYVCMPVRLRDIPEEVTA